MTRIYRIPPPPTGLQDERLRRWLNYLRDTLADSDSTGLQTQIDANEAAITSIDSQVTTIDTTAHILTLLQGAITETELFQDLGDRIDLIDTPTTGLLDRVTAAEGDITANQGAITTLQADLTSAEGNITGNANAITALDVRVTDNEGDISAQGTALTNLDARVTTAEGNITGNADAITALTVDVNANTSGVSSNASAVTALDVRLTTAESDVAQALTDAAGAQATADGKVTTFFQGPSPTADAVGDLWFDTGAGYRAHRWSGSAWVDIQDTGIGQAIADAAGAQATADGKVTTFWQASAPTADAVGDLWFDTDDGNHPYRWNGSSWEDAQDGTIQAHASAITTLQSDVTTAEGNITANASDITQLQSDVGGNTAAISTEASTRATADGLLNAEYTVKLDVNGYVAGFGIAVDGGASGPLSSSFIVRANQFAIAFPGATWAATTAYGLNAYVLPSVATGYQYRASTAGTSGGTEPTWPTTPGNTVADGSVVWTCEALDDIVPFVVGLVEGVPTVGIDGNLVVDGTLKTNAIEVGTLTGFVVQTAASGERIVLNGASYEAEFYGDRGDSTVELLASIGVRSESGDNVIGYFGSANSSRVAVRGRAGTGDAIFGTSSSGYGGVFEIGTFGVGAVLKLLPPPFSGPPSHNADAGSMTVDEDGRLYYKPFAGTGSWPQINPSFYCIFSRSGDTPTLNHAVNVASVSYVSGNVFRITFDNELVNTNYVPLSMKTFGPASGTTVDDRQTTHLDIDLHSSTAGTIFVFGIGA